MWTCSKIKTHTDEGCKLKLDMLKIVGMGKDCAIHETIREMTSCVLVICSIVPENVDGIDDSKTFKTLNADKYTRRFNGQITAHQNQYVNWLMGKDDIFSINIGVACEIFAWCGIRPSDKEYNELFTRAYAWVSLYDYWGNDDGYDKSLRIAHDKITTMGRPTSMVYNSLACLLVRSEIEDTTELRCHIDDKLLARSHQTATYPIVDNLWPELPAEILNYCAISMAMFTDAIDVIHDYHKCQTSNCLIPFVIRGYCIRSVILSSYRKTLSILPDDDYRQKFRDSIKRTIYACVTSGRHFVMEQVIGCHCSDENRICTPWIPKDCKYCTAEDGEDYMDLFQVDEFIEPTLDDRNKLMSSIYAYLVAARRVIYRQGLGSESRMDLVPASSHLYDSQV